MSRNLVFVYLVVFLLKYALASTRGGYNADKDNELDSSPTEEAEAANSTQNPNTRAQVSTNPNDIDFYLYYDKNNPDFADRLLLGDTRSVKSAHFVIGKPVIFVTHGFLSGYDMPNSLVPFVKNAYLKMGFVNIIATDWRRLALAEGPFAPLAYYSVMSNGVPITGTRICKMIRFLMKTNIITGPEQVHLVGHSLGAHASGIAGYCIKQKTGKLVDRITGLDPAGPLYQFVKPESRLDAGWGSFVDVLHTDIGQLGNDMQLGTVDFYSNGGKGFAQPNCVNFTLNNLGSIFAETLVGFCAHSRSYEIFARSILRTKPELYGCRCSPTNSFVLPSTCVSPMNICNDKTLYGEYVPRTAKGTFYINTGTDLPGLGVVAIEEAESAVIG